jgi:HEAT repeat protein
MKMLSCLSFALVLAWSGPAQAQKADPEKIIARLIADYKKTTDNATRAQLVSELTEFGAQAKDAVPVLIDALQTKDEDLRLHAAIALGKIGKEAVAPLAEILSGKDADARFYAIWALGWIGPAGKETAPALLKALGDEQEGVRRKAAYALGRVGADAEESVPALIKLLGDKSQDVREAAGEGLSKFGKAAVPALMEALKDKKTRRQAAVALGEVGSDAKAAIAALKAALLNSATDKDELPPNPDGNLEDQPRPVPGGGPIGFPGRPGRRPFIQPFPFPGGGGEESSTGNVYADALAKIGKSAIPALQDVVKDGKDTIRPAAIAALAKIGGDAVPMLVDFLGDKRVDVRRAACGSLVPLRIADKMVVQGFAFALKDEDEQVRNLALQGIQTLGAAAKAAVPALHVALTDMNINVRQQAFWTLQNMGENPREGLLKGLDNKDVKVRINSASLMMTMGIDQNTALPVLEEALKEKDTGLRMQAAHALAITNRGSEKVVPVLVEGIKHSSMGVRQQALQGLQNMGPRAGVAAPALLEMMQNDPEPGLRQQAIYALQNVRGDPEAIVPVLAKLIKDGDQNVRTVALQVIPQYGAKALPHILAALKDKEPNTRQQAIYSLQNLQGDLKGVVDQIKPLLKDDNNQVRQGVVQILGRLGEAGLPLVEEALQDKDANVKWQAIHMMRNLRQPLKAIPALVEMVKGKDQNWRINAVQSLPQFGAEGADALLKAFPDISDKQTKQVAMQTLIYSQHRAKVVPMVLENIEKGDAQTRLMCIQMIQNVGQVKEAVPLLTKALKDTDQNVRNSAIHALAQQGAEGLNALEAPLKGGDTGTRQNVLQAWSNYGFRPVKAVPVIIECLKDGNPQVRWTACQVLGNIGKDAQDAAALIQDLAQNDSNPTVRNIAQNALQRIGAPPRKEK